MWQLLEFMWTGGYARLDTLLILHGYERMRFMFIPTNESKIKMDNIPFVKKNCTAKSDTSRSSWKPESEI